ncbi:hypothetical protein SAMN05443573_10575 [Celeribacter indicus]|nr:hypothetical protein SAMN05443573_10575 [Celeribacter indicus]
MMFHFALTRLRKAMPALIFGASYVTLFAFVLLS